MAKKDRAGNGELFASAAPTKRFFVDMLTRDIELRDAILDLLDNCLDGIVRSLPPAKLAEKNPYSGHWAKITATPDRFVIEDNCGGIPLEVAQKIAFRLGRPADAPRENLQTVGVYGIGMKRAIFKLGENASVTSESKDTRFRVEINGAWLSDDSDWDLPLHLEPTTGKLGTTIEVTKLKPEIRREFDPKLSSFLTDLNGSIRELYSVIMGKGFKVTLNTLPLEPIAFRILMTLNQRKASSESINPYVFKGRFGGVNVLIVVGFYRKPLTEDELDAENESPKADLSQAGWSIICNDRLVVRGDKTILTGWGTANVPRFHNQFSSIAGVVSLQSANPSELPLNTTKRGIEASSDIYFRLLDYMREGVKKFTNYTNHWKSRHEEGKAQFEIATPTAITDIADAIPPSFYKAVSSQKLANSDAQAQVFNPPLPKPAKTTGDLRKIVFSRPMKEIQLVAEELLDDREASPSSVGEECFDAQLRKLKPSRR